MDDALISAYLELLRGAARFQAEMSQGFSEIIAKGHQAAVLDRLSGQVEAIVHGQRRLMSVRRKRSEVAMHQEEVVV